MSLLEPGDILRHPVFFLDCWGPPVGDGTTDARYCNLGGVAKINAAEAPFIVANDFLGGRLAQFLGLPSPPGLIVVTDTGDLAYASVRFGRRGELPPPVVPRDVVSENLRFASGVIVFDCWISNTDRHEWNLAYSRENLESTAVFDHTRSLFGHRSYEAGRAYVQRMREVPVVEGCLPTVIESIEWFSHWEERIRLLPEASVRDTVNEATGHGALCAEDASLACDFLIWRKRNISVLIDKARDHFPRVGQWRLTP